MHQEHVALAPGAGTIEHFSIPIPAPTPPPTPAPKGDCDFKDNLDWHPETFSRGAHKHVASADACCALCDADAQCVVATYAGSTCYLKAEVDQAGGSYAHDGVTSCRKKKQHARQRQPQPAMASGLDGFDGTKALLVATVTDDALGSVVSSHPILYAPPKQLQLPKANVTFTVSEGGLHGRPTIEVKTDAVALYVTFTTLAQGRFSDNAFLLLPQASRTIDFIPFEGFDFAELKSTLRVEHVASYM